MKTTALQLLSQGSRELGIELSAPELAKFGILGDELQKWNKKVNLTAVRDEASIVVKHFLDSLTLLPVLSKEGSLLDIGSGGGFPVLPLKIMRPDMEMVSVDAVEKKILFQRHAGRILQLKGFDALHARGEDLPKKYAEAFDFVVSRAFSDLSFFAGMALPLLKKTGLIIAMKGSKGEEEMATERDRIQLMGLDVLEIKRFQLPISADERALILFRRGKMDSKEPHD